MHITNFIYVGQCKWISGSYELLIWIAKCKPCIVRRDFNKAQHITTKLENILIMLISVLLMIHNYTFNCIRIFEVLYCIRAVISSFYRYTFLHWSLPMWLTCYSFHWSLMVQTECLQNITILFHFDCIVLQEDFTSLGHCENVFIVCVYMHMHTLLTLITVFLFCNSHNFKLSFT